MVEDVSVFCIVGEPPPGSRATPTKAEGQSAPEEDLLSVFMAYAAVINMGVTLDRPHDDGGYLYGVLCPKLISYGLVTRTVIEEEGLGTVVRMRYDMSEMGHKFHSLMEKVIRLQKK